MVIGHEMYYWLKLRLKKNGCPEGKVTCFEHAIIADLTQSVLFLIKFHEVSINYYFLYIMAHKSI
jgi:hypothetical protein